jgi:predicted metal-binding protein
MLFYGFQFAQQLSRIANGECLICNECGVDPKHHRDTADPDFLLIIVKLKFKVGKLLM